MDILVIGGGPAGLLAAGRAAQLGRSALLVEKNDRLGKKLNITGKGRCNVTNSADMSDFIANTPINGRFLYSAFSAFSNSDLRELLARYGVPTKEERGGRIFPKSDTAKDVTRALAAFCREQGVRFVRDRALKILKADGRVCGVQLAERGNVRCACAIVATGGLSYPQTGSTGDGYRFAEAVGHTVVPPRPSLVPLVTQEDWPKEAMGLSLRNTGIRILDDKNKLVYEDFGELLFTHYGVSGPVILSASAHLRGFPGAKYRLLMDLKPALDSAALDARILRDFASEPNRDFVNSLGALLPKKLIPIAVRLSGIDPRKKVNAVTKPERAQLGSLLKALPLTLAGTRPIAEAIVTSGGVSVREVNPKTMESRLLPGLYFAGEVLDVDAYTGGFNLQIAFSTGYLAGSRAAVSEPFVQSGSA